MTLEEFYASPKRDKWLYEPGLHYYVARLAPYPDVIILKNCHSDGSIWQPYRRFYRRYIDHIPFIAEQVMNLSLARFYEARGWMGKRDLANIPSYISPLVQKLYGAEPFFQPYNESKPSIYLEQYYDK